MARIPKVPSEHPENPGDVPRYEVYPPKLDNPRIVSPTDPYLRAPDPRTTRRPYNSPSTTPVYGDRDQPPDSQTRQIPPGRPVRVTPFGPTPVRDPEPFDRGPSEANDYRPPIVLPGERWASKDK